MPVQEPPKAPAAPQYTTTAETKAHLAMVEHKKQFVKKEGDEKHIYTPVNVTPRVAGVSIDRGEYLDQFYVVKNTKTEDGALVPVVEGSFLILCKDFLRDYKQL